MAKVNIHREDCAALPRPEDEETWSTLNVPEEDREIAETAEDVQSPW
jgi:multicomponent K+:H+ antiporter subunit G